MENKERISVKLTVGGIYRVSPFKCEFKEIDTKAGKKQALSISFSVDLGTSFDCWVNKMIFFKSTEQIREEVKFLLKLLAPELLQVEYKATNFKDFAFDLCKDLNNTLKSARDEKRRLFFHGKMRKKKDSDYVDFEEFIPLTGNFRVNWLAELSDTSSQWFTPWELDNCVVPFERKIKENQKEDSSFDPFSTANEEAFSF